MAVEALGLELLSVEGLDTEVVIARKERL